MKLISLIALLALVVISEQRVHVKNQLKRSKTVKRVQKSHASTKLNFDFSWQEHILPMASQAYIQWQLRNNGFEIRCDGLDNFPNDSVQLKSLLYQPNT